MITPHFFLDTCQVFFYIFYELPSAGQRRLIQLDSGNHKYGRLLYIFTEKLSDKIKLLTLSDNEKKFEKCESVVF